MTHGVSDLLRASWRLYRSSIALLSGYLAWLLLPNICLMLLPFLPASPWSNSLGTAVSIIGVFLSFWVMLIVIRILSAAATGRHETLPTVVAASRARLAPFVWVSVLSSLAVLGGFILLVIPGFVFLIWYAFASMEAAVGGKHGLGALASSRALVRGKFWPVAWRLIAGPLVLVVWYAIVMGIIFLPLLIATGTPVATISSENPPLWFVALDAVGQLFFLTPLLLAYVVLLYHSMVVQESAV